MAKRVYATKQDYPADDMITLFFTDGSEKIFDLDILTEIRSKNMAIPRIVFKSGFKIQSGDLNMTYYTGNKYKKSLKGK